MSESVKTVTLSIDGRQAQVPEGTTILEAARQVDIEIPTLCQDDRLQPFGACRMCVVAIKAMRGRLTTACSTPVSEGMEVETSNEMIDRVRQSVLELLLVHHPLDCPVCDKAGECKLQDYAYKYGAIENRLDGYQTKSDLPPETRSPLIERVPNRCILCGLCTRVCDEVQCVGEISFVRRGFGAGIGTLFDRPLECQFCGQCIAACPVGALLARPFKYKVRVWELQQTPSICNWCGVGCRIVIEHKRNKVYRIHADKGLGVNLGNLCGKGRYGFGYLDVDQRVTQPLVRQNGELQPATWEEALARAAELIKQTKQEYGEKALGLIAGPRVTNEALWSARELFAGYLGTENIGGQQEDLAAPLVQGVKSVLGSGGNATYADVFAADAILVVANDGVDSAPVLGNRVIARSRVEGVNLIVIDSRLTAQMKKAQLPLQCRPAGSDDALAALLATVIDENLGAGRPDVLPLRASLGDAQGLASHTGLPLDEIQAAARAFAQAKNKLIIVGSVPYDRAVSRRLGVLAADLALLTGAGLLSMLEKSNLRGAVELGLLPGDSGTGYDQMLAPGGNVRTIMVLGDDPHTHAPGGKAVRNGLEKLDGLIVSDLYLSETARHADVVLPAAAFSEQNGTITNSEGRVQSLGASVDAPGEAKPDWQIIMELGLQLGWDQQYSGVAEVHAAMAQSEPWAGAELPPPGEAVALAESAGTGELSAPAPSQQAEILADFPFLLMTGPLLWHSGTTSGRSAHLDDVYHGPRVYLNEDDADRLEIEDGRQVRLIGPDWQVEAVADVGNFAAAGCVFLPNHHPGAPAAAFFRDGRATVRIEKV